MSLQAAFIFLAQGADNAQHRATVRTPRVDQTVVGVADYAAAEKAAVGAVRFDGYPGLGWKSGVEIFGG